jgi:hypothetical protein
MTGSKEAPLKNKCRFRAYGRYNEAEAVKERFAVGVRVAS